MFCSKKIKLSVILVKILISLLLLTPVNLYAFTQVRGRSGETSLDKGTSTTKGEAIKRIREEKYRILTGSENNKRPAKKRPFEASKLIDKEDYLLRSKIVNTKLFGISPGKGAIEVLIFLVLFCLIAYLMYRFLLMTEFQ